MGNPVIVWADVFSLPHKGLDPSQMWAMQPFLIVGQPDGGFLLADGEGEPVTVSAADRAKAR